MVPVDGANNQGTLTAGATTRTHHSTESAATVRPSLRQGSARDDGATSSVASASTVTVPEVPSTRTPSPSAGPSRRERRPRTAPQGWWATAAGSRRARPASATTAAGVPARIARSRSARGPARRSRRCQIGVVDPIPAPARCPRRRPETDPAQKFAVVRGPVRSAAPSGR